MIPFYQISRIIFKICFFRSCSPSRAIKQTYLEFYSPADILWSSKTVGRVLGYTTDNPYFSIKEHDLRLTNLNLIMKSFLGHIPLINDGIKILGLSDHLLSHQNVWIRSPELSTYKSYMKKWTKEVKAYMPVFQKFFKY